MKGEINCPKCTNVAKLKRMIYDRLYVAIFHCSICETIIHNLIYETPCVEDLELDGTNGEVCFNCGKHIPQDLVDKSDGYCPYCCKDIYPPFFEDYEFFRNL